MAVLRVPVVRVLSENQPTAVLYCTDGETKKRVLTLCCVPFAIVRRAVSAIRRWNNCLCFWQKSKADDRERGIRNFCQCPHVFFLSLFSLFSGCGVIRGRLTSYRLFNAVCPTALPTSICALTFWILESCSLRRANDCFYLLFSCAMVASCSCTFRCSLRNSLSSIAFTWS